MAIKSVDIWVAVQDGAGKFFTAIKVRFYSQTYTMNLYM